MRWYKVPTAPLVGRNVAPDSHAIKLLDGALNQQRVDDAAPGAERVYSKGYAHSEFEYITVFFTYGEDYTGCKVGGWDGGRPTGIRASFILSGRTSCFPLHHCASSLINAGARPSTPQRTF